MCSTGSGIVRRKQTDKFLNQHPLFCNVLFLLQPALALLRRLDSRMISRFWTNCAPVSWASTGADAGAFWVANFASGLQEVPGKGAGGGFGGWRGTTSVWRMRCTEERVVRITRREPHPDCTVYNNSWLLSLSAKQMSYTTSQQNKSIAIANFKILQTNE